MGVLTVKLINVTNLIDSDGLGRSDPYVKFQLEQDNTFLDKNYGRKESTHKGNTCNPTYNENFYWEKLPSLNNMKLWIKVMDNDIGMDDQIGKACINLEGLHLDQSPRKISVTVDKKRIFSLNPIKCMYNCCCCLLRKDAEIHLELSYAE